MKLSLIVGVGKKQEIGIEGQLPWHLPEDLKSFKRLTMGHHMLMGRTTFESIGKALPGRQSLILSQQKTWDLPNCHSFKELKAALSFARQAGEKELFIIGGERVYKDCLPLANRIYMSRVDTICKDADRFFPPIKEEDWQNVCQEDHPKTEKTPAWSLVTLDRTKTPLTL